MRQNPVSRLLIALWKQRAALFRFFIGGLISIGTALSVTTASHVYLGLSTSYAGALGFVGALAINFVVMRAFVFKDHSGALRTQVSSYLAAAAMFRSLEYVVYLLLSGLVSVQYQIAMIAVMVGSSLVKFFVYDRLVFRKRVPAEKAGQASR